MTDPQVQRTRVLFFTAADKFHTRHARLGWIGEHRPTRRDGYPRRGTNRQRRERRARSPRILHPRHGSRRGTGQDGGGDRPRRRRGGVRLRRADEDPVVGGGQGSRLRRAGGVRPGLRTILRRAPTAGRDGSRAGDLDRRRSHRLPRPGSGLELHQAARRARGSRRGGRRKRRRRRDRRGCGRRRAGFGADARKLAASAPPGEGGGDDAKKKKKTGSAKRVAETCGEANGGGGVVVVTADRSNAQTRTVTMYKVSGGEHSGRSVKTAWEFDVSVPEGASRAVAVAAGDDDACVMWSNGVWRAYTSHNDESRMRTLVTTGGVNETPGAGGAAGKRTGGKRARRRRTRRPRPCPPRPWRPSGVGSTPSRRWVPDAAAARASRCSTPSTGASTRAPRRTRDPRGLAAGMAA